MAPVVFLLANRVFSPQYLVTTVASWPFAAALVARDALDALLLVLLAWGATLANVLVYPIRPARGFGPC